jgi:hypothetical protein
VSQLFWLERPHVLNPDFITRQPDIFFLRQRDIETGKDRKTLLRKRGGVALFSLDDEYGIAPLFSPSALSPVET